MALSYLLMSLLYSLESRLYAFVYRFLLGCVHFFITKTSPKMDRLFVWYPVTVLINTPAVCIHESLPMAPGPSLFLRSNDLFDFTTNSTSSMDGAAICFLYQFSVS